MRAGANRLQLLLAAGNAHYPRARWLAVSLLWPLLLGQHPSHQKPVERPPGMQRPKALVRRYNNAHTPKGKTMAGPITQAGGTVEPSEYAALSMDAQFTGEWTQRNPLRDADVPYLYRKFYSASRFDSMIDGINREISARLTDVRRPGSSPYNASSFSAINSFYSFKWIQSLATQLRVMADAIDGNVYDISGGGKVNVFSKTAGSGKMRFLGIGNTLYMADQVDQVKMLRSSTAWAATTNIKPGSLIVNGNPGVVQMALGGITMNVVATASTGAQVFVWIDPQSIPLQFANLQGASVTFAGLTAGAFLNGLTFPIVPVSTTEGIFLIVTAHGAYNQIADTGTGTTGTGITGGSAPAFSSTPLNIVADSGQQWKCYGPAVENWGLTAPTKAPIITALNGTRYWQPSTALTFLYAILDNNQNVQVVNGAGTTGRSYPTFSAFNNSTAFISSSDGSVNWINYGPIGAWQALAHFGNTTVVGQYAVILDSNFNLQIVTNGLGAAAGGAAPVWATVIGNTTVDGGLTWTCLGPGVVLTTATVKYVFAFHAIDGSVSTASPIASIIGPILGASNLNRSAPWTYLSFQSTWASDTQVDQIWMFRTAQGQSTPVFEDAVPIDNFTGGGAFYAELAIPDTSTNGVAALSATVIAPTGHVNDPPPATATAPEYHVGRIWTIDGFFVRYSGGPDTITGNGNNTFPPLNFFQMPEQPIRLKSVTLQSGGGLLVVCLSNTYIILGEGTANSPFTRPKIYMARVGAMSYDAVDMVGSTLYVFTNTNKMVSCDVGSGYTEIGFPIGDQFTRVTTGGISSALYNPASTYVSWHEKNSGDTAMYVSDGAVGWFRFSPIAPPETGSLWSPRAAILGGTSAVQSIETAPGIFNLLIGPATTGPILMRDPAQTGDWNGAAFIAFPSWDVKGSIGLCETGEVAEIAHIALKSIAVGARPTVSILLDELAAGVTVEGETTAWDVLDLDAGRHEDPPNLAPSITMYSDRYKALANGTTPKCQNFQLKVDYGSQLAADELLAFAVYGATSKERKQQ